MPRSPIWFVQVTSSGATVDGRTFADRAQADAFADGLERCGYTVTVTPWFDLLPDLLPFFDFMNRQYWLREGARYGLRDRGRRRLAVRERRPRLRP